MPTFNLKIVVETKTRNKMGGEWYYVRGIFNSLKSDLT